MRSHPLFLTYISEIMIGNLASNPQASFQIKHSTSPILYFTELFSQTILILNSTKVDSLRFENFNALQRIL